jgi:hypothetical protein
VSNQEKSGGRTEAFRRLLREQRGEPEETFAPTPEQVQEQSRLMSLLKKGRKTGIMGDAELRRVLDLPISLPLSPEEFEDVNRQFVNADKFQAGWRLFPPQAQALRDYDRFGGAFCPIGVGWGKTLITLKAADIGYRKGLRKILLMPPPEVYTQLVKRDIPWARNYVTLGVPFYPLGRKTLKQREKLVRSGRPGCYIMPYSLLSTRDTDFLLESIMPELILADEAHLIKNTRAARTRRIINFINEHVPQMVALSGTITNKGIRDYHHLIRICLAAGCPLPRNPIMAAEWGSIIDSDAEFLGFDQTKSMIPLLAWAKAKFPDEKFPGNTTGFRRAFKHRLTTTPGVVATSDEEIQASLLIENIAPTKMEEAEGFDRLQELMAQVQDDFVTPNGDEIEHAIHTFKWLQELSAGFYNELVWPSPASLARRKGWTVQEAERALHRAQEHHQAQQEYARELRAFLNDRPPKGMDTPMLVGLAIYRDDARVPAHLAELWDEVKALEWEGMPQRDSNVIRVCDYKVQAAVRWAEGLPKGSGGVIWTHHKAMGLWLMEAFKGTGVDVIHCPAGNAGGERIMDVANAGKVCVASIEAHGTGKNLQHFAHQLFLQWPRPAKTAEQTLGRLHRNGQQADEVRTTCLRALPWDDMVFAATLNDAIYITQTTGLRQRLIKASYNPLPKIYSPEFLLERGIENTRVLNREQRAMMQDRFGEQDGQEQD